MSDPIAFSECFRSLQGEGPSAGRLATFFRTAGCNLHCNFCDTPWTWDWTRYNPRTEVQPLALDAAQALLRENLAPLLVVTGGEPTLQAAALEPLLRYASDTLGQHIEVETNGTLPPPLAMVGYVDQWNVSPKLAHSGNDPLRAWTLPALMAWARHPGTLFKFVVQTPDDLPRIAHFQEACTVPATAIWLMPEGRDATTLTERLRWLAPLAVAAGWNCSSRLQVYAWGDARGH